MIFVSLNHYINLHLLYSGQRGGGDAVVPPFPTVMRTVDKKWWGGKLGPPWIMLK